MSASVARGRELSPMAVGRALARSRAQAAAFWISAERVLSGGISSAAAVAVGASLSEEDQQQQSGIFDAAANGLGEGFRAEGRVVRSIGSRLSSVLHAVVALVGIALWGGPLAHASVAVGARTGAVEALDGSGNLLATAYLGGAGVALQPVFLPGTISTVAGNGTLGYSGDGGAAASARFNAPSGLAFDGAGKPSL